MEQDCIFCKIVSGQIPSFKVYEDDAFLAFLDISQFTEGHTLLVPKAHKRFIWDIEDGARFFEVAQRIANHYSKLGYQYVDSLSFGRQVAHAHLHLIPHNGEDVHWNKALSGLEYFHSPEHTTLSREEGEALAAKLSLHSDK